MSWNPFKAVKRFAHGLSRSRSRTRRSAAMRRGLTIEPLEARHLLTGNPILDPAVDGDVLVVCTSSGDVIVTEVSSGGTLESTKLKIGRAHV